MSAIIFKNHILVYYNTEICLFDKEYISSNLINVVTTLEDEISILKILTVTILYIYVR